MGVLVSLDTANMSGCCNKMYSLLLVTYSGEATRSVMDADAPTEILNINGYG